MPVKAEDICVCKHGRHQHFIHFTNPGCGECVCDRFVAAVVQGIELLPAEHYDGVPGFEPCSRGDHNPNEPCAHKPLPGYHMTKIERGVLGEISKIEEEFAEFMDATKQEVAVMQLVELSDLFGAIEAWLQKYHPNVTLQQLVKMKDVTGRAFKNGYRGRK